MQRRFRLRNADLLFALTYRIAVMAKEGGIASRNANMPRRRLHRANWGVSMTFHISD